MEIANGIYYVGTDDKDIDLFEGILPVEHGMAYNSYIIKDEKIAVLDSVDAHFGDEWLKNIQNTLGGAKPDYLVVLHMEPDHSANVLKFAQKYPEAEIVGNFKTFVMLKEYFGTDFNGRQKVVKDGEKLSLGKHELNFVFAPMVHWPEVMTAYESFTKTLFSADAFGKFGANSHNEEWDGEARRYYFAIVGKYGVQVQSLLNKLSAYEIKTICSLHGPVLKENLNHYLELYTKWAAYKPEIDGVFIAYSSVYGHTKAAAEELYAKLIKSGVKAEICDVVRTERTYCIAKAFEYSKIVFATTTYNADIFPAMREFIDCLTERNFQNRTVGIIENGSWAPFAKKVITAKLEKCKNLNFTDTTVTVHSATFDLRFTSPNREPVMDVPAIHTIEHLGATFLRNSSRKEEVLYFGPMGCRTGFYLLMFGGHLPKNIFSLVLEMCDFILDFEGDIPGAKPEECGNFSEQNLSVAKYYVKRYKSDLKRYKRFVYKQ